MLRWKVISERLLHILERIRNMQLDSALLVILFLFIAAFGLLNCFLGFRLMRVWVMLAGFAAGAAAGLLIVYRTGTEQKLYYGAAALGAGLLVALIAFFVYQAGIFLMGAGLGLLGSLYFIHPRSSGSFYLCVLCGTVLGALALHFSREIIIISTSLAGGALAGFAASKLLQKDLLFGLLLGAAAALLGSLVQFLTNRTGAAEEEKTPAVPSEGEEE